MKASKNTRSAGRSTKRARCPGDASQCTAAELRAAARDWARYCARRDAETATGRDDGAYARLAALSG
jgi:hypothetical protein